MLRRKNVMIPFVSGDETRKYRLENMGAFNDSLGFLSEKLGKERHVLINVYTQVREAAVTYLHQGEEKQMKHKVSQPKSRV